MDYLDKGERWTKKPKTEKEQKDKPTEGFPLLEEMNRRLGVEEVDPPKNMAIVFFSNKPLKHPRRTE